MEINPPITLRSRFEELIPRRLQTSRKCVYLCVWGGDYISWGKNSWKRTSLQREKYAVRYTTIQLYDGCSLERHAVEKIFLRSMDEAWNRKRVERRTFATPRSLEAVHSIEQNVCGPFGRISCVRVRDKLGGALGAAVGHILLAVHEVSWVLDPGVQRSPQTDDCCTCLAVLILLRTRGGVFF
jgi:hypothetical protein